MGILRPRPLKITRKQRQWDFASGVADQGMPQLILKSTITDRGHSLSIKKTTGIELPIECHDYLKTTRTMVSLEQLKANAKDLYSIKMTEDLARHIGAACCFFTQHSEDTFGPSFTTDIQKRLRTSHRLSF